MRLFRPLSVFSRLYPDAIFRIKTQEKLLCLTFDDGPDPASTPQILEILGRHGVQAIFFCTGIKAEKYPDLIARIKSAGHLIGNHGYSHLNGWRTSCRSYIEDTCAADIHTSFSLFRPPYGRIAMCQFHTLKKKYGIVFWDLMPYDFDPSFGPARSLGILKEKIRPGSVIALHDTPLSCAGVILVDFLDHAEYEGYSFINTI